MSEAAVLSAYVAGDSIMQTAPHTPQRPESLQLFLCPQAVVG